MKASRVLSVLLPVAAVLSIACSRSEPPPAAQVAASTAASAPAHEVVPARDPITGFRDLAWGASEEALRTTLDTKYCGESGDPTLNYGTRLCHAEGEVPFGDVHGTWVRFYFRDGGLSGWSALYPARDRTTVLLALKQRYGDPVKETSSKVLWSSAKAGVSFTPGSTYDSLYVLTVFEMERHKAEVMAKAGKTAKGF